MPRLRMRASVSASLIRRPSESMYSNPLPLRRRVIPLAEQSIRLSLGIAFSFTLWVRSTKRSWVQGGRHTTEEDG